MRKSVEKLPTPKRSGARGAVTLMVGTFGSRVTGLLRSILMLRLFSPEITDAFLVAWRVPNLFRELLAEGALINSFVPIYKQLDKEEGRKLSSALFSLLFVVNALLVALAVWSAPWVVGVLLQEGSTVDFELTVTLARVVFPFLAAISFSALAMGVLNAEEEFFAPAWAPVAFNVLTIALMLLFPGQAVPLAVAFVLGGVAQLLVQLPALVRNGVMPRLGMWWHGRLARVLNLMAPFAFTTGARQVLNFIAIWSLSSLAQGNITAFETANLVFTLALGLFSVSPSLSYYSRLSADAVENPDAFVHTLQSGLRFITFLTVPTGLYFFVFATPIIDTLFPGIDPVVTRLSTVALAPLGLAVFPWGVNNFLVRPFYVRERVRPPVIISVVFVSLNALLYALLAPRYGIAGMSWATVVVGWAQLGVLLYWNYRDEALPVRRFTSYSLRVWGAAVGAVLAAYTTTFLPFPGGWLGAVLQVATSGVILAITYAALCYLFGVPVRHLLQRLRR